LIRCYSATVGRMGMVMAGWRKVMTAEWAQPRASRDVVVAGWAHLLGCISLVFTLGSPLCHLNLVNEAVRGDVVPEVQKQAIRRLDPAAMADKRPASVFKSKPGA